MLHIQLQENEACEDEPIYFNAVITNPIRATNYQWHVNNMPGGENSPNYTFADLKNNDRIQCIAITDASCLLNP